MAFLELIPKANFYGQLSAFVLDPTADG